MGGGGVCNDFDKGFVFQVNAESILDISYPHTLTHLSLREIIISRVTDLAKFFPRLKDEFLYDHSSPT